MIQSKCWTEIYMLRLMFTLSLSGKLLIGKKGHLETIIETNQTTVEVQEVTESLRTNVEGNNKYKRITRRERMAGKDAIAN